MGVTTTSYEHTYDGSRHLGSIDVTSPGAPVNGKVWKWGPGGGGKSEVLESPQFSSASANMYFQVNDEKNMSRRTYDASRNAGDTTEQTFYSEWMLVNGGAVGQRGTAGSRSELFSAYSTTLDADRSALPVTDHALMLGQTDLEYEVTRVKSPVLGRDLNPMGRGDGAYYADGGNVMRGSVRIGSAKPSFVGEMSFGYGNSINNQGLGRGGATWPPEPTVDYPDPSNAICTEPAIESGKCAADEPASLETSCCNPANIQEAWKTVYGAYKAYRDRCKRGIPERDTACWKMGIDWMSTCFLCFWLGKRPHPPGRKDVTWEGCLAICRGACLQIKLVSEALGGGGISPELWIQWIRECTWCCHFHFLDDDKDLPFDSIECYGAGVRCG